MSSNKYKLEDYQYIAPTLTSIIIHVYQDEDDTPVFSPAIIFWFDNTKKENSFILGTTIYTKDKLHAISLGASIATSFTSNILDSVQVLDSEGDIIEEIVVPSLSTSDWHKQNAPSTITLQ